MNLRNKKYYVKVGDSAWGYDLTCTLNGDSMGLQINPSY